MGKNKTFEQVMNGNADYNIRFNELLGLLRGLQFNERIEGSHHIFTKEDVEGIINIQPVGSMAKGYQVRQMRQVFKHNKIEG